MGGGEEDPKTSPLDKGETLEAEGVPQCTGEVPGGGGVQLLLRLSGGGGETPGGGGVVLVFSWSGLVEGDVGNLKLLGAVLERAEPRQATSLVEISFDDTLTRVELSSKELLKGGGLAGEEQEGKGKGSCTDSCVL